MQVELDFGQALVPRRRLRSEGDRRVDGVPRGAIFEGSTILGSRNMAARAVALVGLVMQIPAPAPPPPLLQIVREPLKPGAEAPFSAIEEERARLAATLGCPHPYLGAESLTGPKKPGGSTPTSRLQSGSRFTKPTQTTLH
jgi:hypothetical protein